MSVTKYKFTLIEIIRYLLGLYYKVPIEEETMFNYKFSFKEILQQVIGLIGFIVLYFINPHFSFITFIIYIAGSFNGINDAINFGWDRIVFRRTLIGSSLGWFEGKFKQFTRDRWWMHAIFQDGWHFFKNLWVLSLLIAITYALFINITLEWYYFFVTLIVCAYYWMIGKQAWHPHFAMAAFWGFDEFLDKGNNRY